MHEKKNILIAEDEQSIVQVMLKSLMAKRRMKYNAYVAMDGLEALESMEEHPIDCLVLDLNMNNCNGLQVLEEMKQNGKLDSTFIIVSSGHIDESMEIQLKSFGVSKFLHKPYPINQLIETIDDVMK